MPEAKQIIIKKITKDNLDDTYPRVTAKVITDKNKEVTLTIFKKKAKEQEDGSTTPSITPQAGHTYMGFFQKPKPPYKTWSFNIAWETHHEEPDDLELPDDEPPPDTEEPVNEEPADEPTHNKPIIESEFVPDETPVIIADKDTQTRRVAIANAVVHLYRGLTREINLTEFIEDCRNFEKYTREG